MTSLGAMITVIGDLVEQAPRSFWYDYQTLITGLLALTAAVIAAWIARGQLRASETQIKVAIDQLEADRTRAAAERSGRLRGARASLPTVLSSICSYSRDAARALHDAWPTPAKLYPDTPLASAYRVSCEVPQFPVELIAPLERIVEFTDAPEVAERIESILREVQVFNARTDELKGGSTVSIGELASYILEAAAIYARAESLFDYARRQSETVSSKPLWDRVFAALLIFGVHDEIVKTKAQREKDNGLSPGEAETGSIL